eukprot:gene15255-32321_t
MPSMDDLESVSDSEPKETRGLVLPKIIFQDKVVKKSLSHQKSSHQSTNTNDDVELFLNNTQSAAGVPVFELIRKMEEENNLTREDRAALHEALYDPERREKIVKAVQDVELSMNSKFALRRLKALLHQNGSGQPCSNVQNIRMSSLDDGNLFKRIPSSRNLAAARVAVNSLLDEDSLEDSSRIQDTVNTHTNITKVVGNDPIYSSCHESTCLKIIRSFYLYQKKNISSSKWQSRKFAVIVGSGSFNPLTRMHLRTFYIAKQAIEKSTDMIILGSLLSPAHASQVRERYRTCPIEVIPSPHRLAIAQLAVEESKWLAVDPWEITRRRAMDYLSLLEHVQKLMEVDLANVNIRILYLCKANMVPKISPAALRKNNFGVVCVCRPPDSDNLFDSLGSRWTGLLYIAEDTAIVDASMDTVSSRRVRDKLKANEPVDQLVGDSVATYFKAHRIGLK